MNLSKIFNKGNTDLYMIDIETDGLSPFENSITSIAIVEFVQDIHKKSDVICECIPVGSLVVSLNERVPETKPCENVTKYRKKNRIDEIEAQMISISIAGLIKNINEFMKPIEGREIILICNHPEFDVSFLQNMYYRHGLNHEKVSLPWKYNNVYDLSSLIRTNRHTKKYLKETIIQRLNMSLHKYKTSDGTTIHDEFLIEHNPLYDCMVQMEMLGNFSIP